MSEKADKPVDTEEESFAELFEQTFKKTERLEPGEKVEARVLKITGEWVFLDTGRKGEGVLDKKELLDPEGNLPVREGDVITAWFLSSSNNEMRFTTKLGSGTAGNARLEEAWRSGIPVEGFIEKLVKGGYEIKIGGSVRAFCPFSQMSLARVEDNEQFVGRHLLFRIIEYAENGRNVIVSHRALLEEERMQQKERLKETLHEGMAIKGKITTIRDFGAFVDVAGIEGLIPISEIAWGRIEDISEVLSVGQDVEVIIKRLDWENDRFSFSLKDSLADPWEQIVERYPAGSYHTGKVARLAPFGAFITLAEGVDGLLHISRLGAGKRINHPREVVKEGEHVEVKIEAVDRENRRLSLSLAEVGREEEEAAETLATFRKSTEEGTKGLGTLGDLLKAKGTGRKK
ncbi:MAG: 30S ribosomal protein S1 [Deltaproteobacteria bacterium]|nr:MAG: 30S ribosomal protein S1 [Deltaproteobacteria bacterium]